MEKGVKEFASQLETLVDRVISGQLAVEVTQNADKLVSGAQLWAEFHALLSTEARMLRLLRMHFMCEWNGQGIVPYVNKSGVASSSVSHFMLLLCCAGFIRHFEDGCAPRPLSVLAI